MTAGDDTVVRRFSDAIQRKGSQAILRRYSNSTGIALLGADGAQLLGADGATLELVYPDPSATLNPPVLDTPRLDGAATAGDTQISIRAVAADGRLIAGDMLTIGTLAPIAIASEAICREPGYDPANPVVPGFDLVTLASPLPADVADGTPIAASWAIDQPIWIKERDFTLREQNDQILGGDLSLTIAAFGVDAPNALDVLIIDGDSRSIVSVSRMRANGQTVAWVVQAR